MKEFLKIVLSLLPQIFLQKHSDNLSAKGAAHPSALNAITAGLCGSGQRIITEEHVQQGLESTAGVSDVNYLNWGYDFVRKYYKPQMMSALSPVAVVTNLFK